MQDLVEKIEKTGLKKYKIAEAIGISPFTLSHILSGTKNYGSQETIDKIHAYLDGLNTNEK